MEERTLNEEELRKKREPLLDSDRLSKEYLEMVRKSMPNIIASDLIGVQPIPSDTILKLRDAAVEEKKLIDDGYEPIDLTTRILWKKKDDDAI